MSICLKTIAFILLVLLGNRAVAEDAQACDITGLPCWGSDAKCNIKLINNTGKSSGSGNSHLNQASWAVTVKALAQKSDGTRAGSNTLEILADQSKTINLDKKDGFDHIKIYTTTGKHGNVKIPCADIQKILQAEKNCKILVDVDNTSENTFYYLSYNCDVAWGRGDMTWVW